MGAEDQEIEVWVIMGLPVGDREVRESEDWEPENCFSSQGRQEDGQSTHITICRST